MLTLVLVVSLATLAVVTSGGTYLPTNVGGLLYLTSNVHSPLSLVHTTNHSIYTTGATATVWCRADYDGAPRPD